MFAAGVLAVAAGSVAVLGRLVRSRLAPLRGATAALLAGWSACLVVVVAFEKIDWSVVPTATGYLHRYAGLVACPPRPWRWGGGGAGTPASRGPVAGAASSAWLVPILLGFLLRPLTGVPWWQFVPLGLFER